AWDDYARHLGDPATLALCRKVRTRVDPRAQADFPAQMSGAVRIETARGAFETYVRVPKGEPENFLTAAELRAKFEGLTAPYLSAPRRETLAAAIGTLEEQRDIGAVLRLTRPDQAGARRVA
ncbi:MAG TPA: hypothetical protein VNK67_09250, partial [Burkholderiales bacterium]|nr:hypothetical protein [Burkholderiales bacterium]